MVTQCATAGDRPTCKGNYPNTGVAETLEAFMRHVACEGQIQMADIGYSPLPPQLSQFIADAIGRMWGRGAETLTRENCANPRFDPNYLLPGGEQPPPLPDPPGVGNIGSGNNSARTTTTGAGGETATTGATSETAAAGRAGEDEAVGGGSDDWRDVDPVAFNRPGMARIGRWPLLVVLLVLLVPVVGGMIYATAQQGRLRRAELGPDSSPSPPPPAPPDD